MQAALGFGAALTPATLVCHTSTPLYPPQAFALWPLIPEPFLTGCLSPVAHAGVFAEWKLVREPDKPGPCLLGALLR